MTTLVDVLAKRVEAEGPIKFSEYMEIALYHPELGYYSKQSPGRGSDYMTGPTLTPKFGQLLARLIERELDSAPPKVIEVGGGGGDLAASIARELPGISWTFIEPRQIPRQIQKKCVDEGLQGNFDWSESLTGVSGNLIIANEVLDNFPCRVFEISERGVDEVHVDTGPDGPFEVLVEAQDGTYPTEPTRHLEVGDRFEVKVGVDKWLQQCYEALTSGTLLIIDYGDTEPHIWSTRPAGTLVTYSDGRLGFDPLEQPGRMDVTAHVNFTEVSRMAAEAGFTETVLMSQRQALLDLGLGEDLNTLKNNIDSLRKSEQFAEMASQLAELSRWSSLITDGQLGSFQFLLAKKRGSSL